ncbi:MAG: hypothetical protein PHW95_01925 [Patescibacteria group bacterium]|nr:hypothetical protein [Patescibacteria group bacterium]
MTKTLKTLIFITIVLSVLGLALNSALALDITSKLTNVAGQSYDTATPNLATTIGQVIKGLLTILGVVFMAYIIYAGYLWMMARGNEESVTKAKAIIRGSIIGIIIVLSAYAITAFVVSKVAAATGFNAGTPQ